MIVIAIVGAGPLGLYALERLAAPLPRLPLRKPVKGLVVDAPRRFGPGTNHHDRQASTNDMNRIAREIALAADESNDRATHLLDPLDRPTFIEWCAAEYARTGDSQFDISPVAAPPRALHGKALMSAFARYYRILQ